MKRVFKTRRLLDFTMLLVAMIGISALPTFGQIDRGAINGKVVDSSGAVVPGAVVTITNKATGVVVYHACGQLRGVSGADIDPRQLCREGERSWI